MIISKNKNKLGPFVLHSPPHQTQTVHSHHRSHQCCHLKQGGIRETVMNEALQSAFSPQMHDWPLLRTDVGSKDSQTLKDQHKRVSCTANNEACSDQPALDVTCFTCSTN